jgi:PPOX class probable FMN-dependent enzyme
MSDSDRSPLKADLPNPEALAPWRGPLARALHRNRSRPYSRYLQLATVTAEGRPANRTVVFRGWLAATNSLTFVTDRRSAKVADVAATPWAEACWYFTTTREQFRLAGVIEVITAAGVPSKARAEARQQAWEALSEKARQQFYWPQPAQPRSGEAAFATVAPNDLAPDSFCLGLLIPHRVDHLELRGDPQHRTLYSCQPDGTWQQQSVNP